MAEANYDFLDEKHPIYVAHEEAWKREERRLYGGDAVLVELTQFEGESDASFAAREKKATYVNFPKAHAAAITGHLRKHAPTPGKGLNFGTLGEVRTRDKVDTPTFAELMYYNVDGVGNDGMEMPAFFDSVDERAQATGHRWLMVEAPRMKLGGTVSMEAVLSGARPYVVEYSPLAVTNWYFRAGQLQFAVVRMAVDEPGLKDGKFVAAGSPGYYLLVRTGYEGLGPTFAGGGWWLFDAEKKPIADGQGTWERTNGEIPMWAHYGEKNTGTTERPALSRSSTMELGQIAVALMDMISARDYDAWEAAASFLLILGTSPEIMQEVAEQFANKSRVIGVKATPSDTGDGERIPNIYDSSTGSVPAEVFKTIIDAKFAEAREQSYQQITSAPDSSGASKEAGYQNEKVPYLARRAALRQQSENTFIYFAELRFGNAKPAGSSVWPREFDLVPLVDDIDRAFKMLRTAGLRSPTLESKMAFSAVEELNLVADDADTEAIKTELNESALQASERAKQSADLLADVGV